MGVTINKKSTTTEPQNGQQPKAQGGGGGLNAFYWYQIFALDSAVVEVQEMFRNIFATKYVHFNGQKFSGVLEKLSFN